MAEVYALPIGNNSDSLTEFKIELLKDHKDDLIFAIDEAIKKLRQYGFQINTLWKRKSLKNLAKDLWELRIKSVRLLLYYDGENFFILLHGFLKTSRQTPRKEIAQAKKEIQKWKTAK